MVKLLSLLFILSLFCGINLSYSADADLYFLKTFLSNERPVLNEQVIVRFYLYSTKENVNYKVKKYPSFTNVQKKFIKIMGQNDIVFHNNRKYFRYLIYESEIYPIALGPSTISPMEISIDWYDSQKGFEEKKLKSPGLILEVMNLPSNQDGGTLSELVGDFEIDFDFKEIEERKGLLKIKIQGKGNLEFLAIPEIHDKDFVVKYQYKEFFPKNASDDAYAIFYYYLEFLRAPTVSSKKIEFFYYNPYLKKFVRVIHKINLEKFSNSSKGNSSKRNSFNSKLVPKKIENGEKTIMKRVIVRSFLVIICLILAGAIFWEKRNNSCLLSQFKRIKRKIRKGKSCYKDFVSFFGILEDLETLDFDKLEKMESFQYFRDMYIQNEMIEFSKDKRGSLVYKKEHFTTLLNWFNKYADCKNTKRTFAAKTFRFNNWKF